MQPQNQDITKDVTFDTDAHTYLKAGVEKMRKAVGSTYGPGGRNVLIQKKYVHPVLTRDGVTVARDIAGHGNKLKHPIEREAAKLVYQASEKTNKTAGDGTTGTVVLLAEVYNAARQRIVAGEDPMAVKKALDRNRDTILEFVASVSKECTEDKLHQVAKISAGEDALGDLVADLMWDVGTDGAVTINYQSAPNIEVEKVTGYRFDQGFRHLGQETTLEGARILVTQKRLATKTDIIPILELMEQTQKQFIIVGDVAGQALETLMWAIANKKADGVPVPAPAFGADGHEFFVDISTYVGGRLILEGDSFSDVKLEDFGTVKAVRINRENAVLFGDNSTGDAIAERIKQIRDQLKGEVTPSSKEQLDTRLAKLAGKVSIIKVGAATEVEREELFFRVEDAVEACKSALSSGIVPGAATTLLFASSLRNSSKKATTDVLEQFVRDALQEPFRLLMANAGYDAGLYLQKTLEAGLGKGYNLRAMDTDNTDPIDLYEAGIVDATKVVLQTVKNAFSVAGSLLTTGAVITEADDEVQAVPQA